MPEHVDVVGDLAERPPGVGRQHLAVGAGDLCLGDAERAGHVSSCVAAVDIKTPRRPESVTSPCPEHVTVLLDWRHVSEPPARVPGVGRAPGPQVARPRRRRPSSGRGSSGGTPAWTGPCRPGWCRASTGGSPSSRRTTRPASRRTSSRRAARDPARTVFFVHGGGFMAPIDPFHVRYAARLATALRRAGRAARTTRWRPSTRWRDSFDPMTDLAERWAKEPGGLVLVGDSAGGGYALALALGAARPRRPAADPAAAALAVGRPDDEHPRDRRQSRRSTRGCSSASSTRTPSGGPARPRTSARPEVSPALADLAGLPPALMFCGTRDLLVPGCRLLARRAAEAGWDLDLRRGARPDPRLPAAAVHPRGAEGLAPDAGVPAVSRRPPCPSTHLDARTAYDVWRLRQDVFVVEQECAVPRPRRARPRARDPARAAARRRRAARLRPGPRRRRRLADRPGRAGRRRPAGGVWPTT